MLRVKCVSDGDITYCIFIRDDQLYGDHGMLLCYYAVFNDFYRADDVFDPDGDAAAFYWEGNFSDFYCFHVCAAARQCGIWNFV